MDRRHLLQIALASTVALPTAQAAALTPCRKVPVREMFEHRIASRFEDALFDKPTGALAFMTSTDGQSIICVQRGMYDVFSGESFGKVAVPLGVWTQEGTDDEPVEMTDALIDWSLEAVLQSMVRNQDLVKPSLPLVKAPLEEASADATHAFFVRGALKDEPGSWVLSRGPVGVWLQTADGSKHGMVVFTHKILRVVEAGS